MFPVCSEGIYFALEDGRAGAVEDERLGGGRWQRFREGAEADRGGDGLKGHEGFDRGGFVRIVGQEVEDVGVGGVRRVVVE